MYVDLSRVSDELSFDKDSITLNFYRVGPERSRRSLGFCGDEYAAGKIGPAQDMPVRDIEL